MIVRKTHVSYGKSIFRKILFVIIGCVFFSTFLTSCSPNGKTGSSGYSSQSLEEAGTTATPIPTATPTLAPTKNPNAKYIALTFDDGPIFEKTERLLAILKEKNVKATFFVLGKKVEEYPEILRKVADAGHEIGNHGYDHTVLTKSSISAETVRTQIEKTNKLIKDITGVFPKSFRPPQGSFNKTVQAITKENGLSIIHWSYESCPEDWKNTDPEVIADFVIENARNGHFVLLHDLHDYTIDAIPKMIDGLLAKGFEFVTVQELIAMGPDKQAIPGKAYFYYNTPTKS